MNSPEGRGGLQVQPERRPWTAEEDHLLWQFKESHEGWTEISDVLPGRSLDSCQLRYQLLRNERDWERNELEETKNKVAMFYKRLKENIWSPIATEMSVVWREVERMHWHLGKNQMRKRGTDDSFPTIRVDLPPPQVDDAQVQAPRQQQDQQPGSRRSTSEWSGVEETSLFAYKRSGMSWDAISKLMPGRTAGSCYQYHLRNNLTEPLWTQERKNELCKRYERLKPNMWAMIGDLMEVPWKSIESLHWSIGEKEMEQRASAARSSQAAFELAPPEEDNVVVHQYSVEEPAQSSHHLQYPQHQTEPAPMAREGRPGSLLTPTVPGILEFQAGVEQLHRLGQRETHQHSDEEADQSSYHVQYPLLPQYRTEPAPMAREGRPGSLLTPTVPVPDIFEFVAGVERLHRQAQRET